MTYSRDAQVEWLRDSTDPDTDPSWYAPRGTPPAEEGETVEYWKGEAERYHRESRDSAHRAGALILENRRLTAEVERLTEQATHWMEEAQRQAIERDKNFVEVQRYRKALEAIGIYCRTHSRDSQTCLDVTPDRHYWCARCIAREALADTTKDGAA